MKKLSLICALLFVVLSGGIAECQELTVQTDSGKHALSRADIESLPHTKVTAVEHSTPALFEGVSLKSVLEKAGVSFGESIRGQRLATCLLVEAADGYKAVFALPELDPAFTEKQILLVFARDGKPLGEKEGPYRIVVPDEKRMARWVRQVAALKIVNVQ